MPSYKIHSIKNNKKLSFIIEGEDSEKVKQTLSVEGFIVITIDELEEEKNKIPRFVFEALKENKSRIEGRVDALDIFSAYEILKNDYQYTIVKLYPIDVTDPGEQDAILKNILQIFPENTKNTKNKEETKSKTLTEMDLLKKHLDILESCVEQGDNKSKDILLYDIKRVQMMNSISSADEVIKKVIKAIYNNGKIEEKKVLYKIIAPIGQHIGMFILPPWVFQTMISIENTIFMMKILFGSPKKRETTKETKKETKKTFFSSIPFLQQNNVSEKKMFTNKNIFILLKKRYRSSWLDIFKSEGAYFYIYSLLRQNRSLFWLKRIQEYIGIASLYSCFLFVFGIILMGVISGPGFLVFTGFIPGIMTIIVLSLVFFFKEI